MKNSLWEELTGLAKRQERCISIILIKLRIFTEMTQELIPTRHWKTVISANILIPKIFLSIMKM